MSSSRQSGKHPLSSFSSISLTVFAKEKSMQSSSTATWSAFCASRLLISALKKKIKNTQALDVKFIIKKIQRYSICYT